MVSFTCYLVHTLPSVGAGGGNPLLGYVGEEDFCSSLCTYFALLWPFLVVPLDLHLQDPMLLYFVV